MPVDKAYLLYRKGKAIMQHARYDEAIEILSEALSVQPHFKTLELLGECHLLAGRPQQAIIPLAAATSLNKGVRSPSLLAEALFESGEYALAEDLAEEALRRDPKNHRALAVQRQLRNVRTQPRV